MKQENKICENCHCEHDGSYGTGRFCSKHCRASYASKIGIQKIHEKNSLNGTKVIIKHKKHKQNIINFICPYCKQEFQSVKSSNKANHIRWCTKNPNINKYKQNLKRLHLSRIGHKAWNKNLTKETSESIRQQSEKLHKLYHIDKKHGTFFGRRHSKETKEKMSEISRNNPYQRKCKKTLPYSMKDGSIVNLDSSYERYIAQFLDKHNIIWIRPNSLKWIDKMGKNHNYFPDFYIPEINIYLDPKNDYCYKVQKEKIDYIKFKYKNVIFLNVHQLNDDYMKRLLTEYGIKFY